MPSRTTTPEAPYTSENENMRPDGDAGPPQAASTPKGAEHSAVSSKTRTDPQTGEPTGGKPEAGG